MKIFIRIIQVLLSLWNIVGGIYMMSNYASLASAWALGTLPAAFWTVLGVAQIVLSVGLLISVGNGALRKYATPSAICLAVISLLGTVIYAAYAGFPGMLWGIVPAVLLVFVAYNRRAT